MRKLVVILCALTALTAVGCTDETPISTALMEPDPTPPTVDPSMQGLVDVYLAPIPGLTTRWHPVIVRESAEGDRFDVPTLPKDGADVHLIVPRGAEVQLKCEHEAKYSAKWSGAAHVDVSKNATLATFRKADIGDVDVELRVESGRDHLRTYRFRISSIDITPEEIRVRDISMSVPMIPHTLSYEAAKAAYFGGSIADLKEVGPNHFATSVDRPVSAWAEVDPPAFAPMTEWRYSDGSASLGRRSIRSFRDTGEQLVEAGWPERAQMAKLTTYRVKLIRPEEPEHVWPSGQPVTFRALTNPAGFEDQVRWLAWSKWGVATPDVGRGPEFTVQFQKVFDNDRAWLGVKADHNKAGSDPPCATIQAQPSVQGSCHGGSKNVQVFVTCGGKCVGGIKTVSFDGVDLVGSVQAEAQNIPGNPGSATVTSNLCYQTGSSVTVTLECVDGTKVTLSFTV